MALLVDEVAEAALGPWGIVVGAGIGIALLARKRLAPAAGTAAVGGIVATERAREWMAGLTVTDRAKAALAELSEWWGDLYAEAQAEWQASQSVAPTAGVASAAVAATAVRGRRSSRTSTPPVTRPATGGQRTRGPDGRFARRSEA